MFLPNHRVQVKVIVCDTSVLLTPVDTGNEFKHLRRCLIFNSVKVDYSSSFGECSATVLLYVKAFRRLSLRIYKSVANKPFFFLVLFVPPSFFSKENDVATAFLRWAEMILRLGEIHIFLFYRCIYYLS